MSWNIRCVENTVKISKKCAKDVYKAQCYGGPESPGAFFNSPDEVTEEGFLFFNSNYNEDQDFLNREEIVDVLKKHKCKGVVVFRDVEQSDNPYGDYWMHEFDGKGGYEYYTGIATITWSRKGKD